MSLFLHLALAHGQCVGGNENDMRLAQIFNDLKNPDNSIVLRWRDEQMAQRVQQAQENAFAHCIPCQIAQATKNKDFFELLNETIRKQQLGQTPSAEDLAKARPKRLCSTCIKASLSLYANSGGNSVSLCKRENDNPTRYNGAPCITSEMASYQKWLIEKAAHCLSSPDKPVNTAEIFRIFNNENRFSFFTESINEEGVSSGVGIAQLTDVAYRDLVDRGKEPILSYIKNRRPLPMEKPNDIMSDAIKKRYNTLVKAENERQASCEIFHKLIDPLPKKTPAQSSCPLTQPGNGQARAILFGIGYFMFLKDAMPLPSTTSGGSLVSGVMGLIKQLKVFKADHSPLSQEQEEELEKISYKLAETAFSSVGPQGALEAHMSAAKDSGCFSKCTPAALKKYAQLISQGAYHQKMAKSLRDLNDKFAEVREFEALKLSREPDLTEQQNLNCPEKPLTTREQKQLAEKRASSPPATITPTNQKEPVCTY